MTRTRRPARPSSRAPPSLFDGFQIFGREGTLVGEVVVKAVIDHRADRDLRLRVQFLHRVREQVRGRMAEDVQAIGVLVGDDRRATRRDRSVAAYRRVRRPALPAERCLGEAGADRGRDFGTSPGGRTVGRSRRASVSKPFHSPRRRLAATMFKSTCPTESKGKTNYGKTNTQNQAQETERTKKMRPHESKGRIHFQTKPQGRKRSSTSVAPNLFRSTFAVPSLCSPLAPRRLLRF